MHNMRQQSVNVEPQTGSTNNSFAGAWLARRHRIPFHIARLLAEVQNLLEIICAKQRMGPTGSVHVFCDPGASAARDLGRAA